MKVKNLLIILGGVIVLAGLIFGASVIYKKLAAKTETENVVEYQTTAAAGSTMVDSQARDFTMQDADGNEVKLSDFSGKPVVLNFWASWCPPCRAEMPDFEEMYKEYGDRINFIFVNLTDGSRETKETADKFIAEQGFSFPIYYDVNGEGSDAYDLYYIPDTYFIDGSGNVTGAAVGGIDKATMQKYIEELVK